MENYTSKIISELLDDISTSEQAKTDAKMLIAAKIAEAMKAKAWKHKDLLNAMAKTNPSLVTKWLSGTHNFTIETLIELESVLDVNFLNLSVKEFENKDSEMIIPVKSEKTKTERKPKSFSEKKGLTKSKMR